MFYEIVSRSAPGVLEDEGTIAADSNLSLKYWLVVSACTLIEFLSAPAWALGTQLPLYAINSHLRLSSADGAWLNLLFRGLSFVSRLMAGLVSLKIKATKIVHIFLLTFILACMFILFKENELTYTELQWSVVILGIANGPLLSTNMLIYEETIHLNPRITGIIVLGNVVVLQIFPLMAGLFIEAHPLILFSSTGTLVFLAFVCHTILSIFRPKIKKEFENLK